MRSGSLATDYRGQVSIAAPSRTPDCVGPQPDDIAYTFTGGDAGSDVVDRAQPAGSNWMHVPSSAVGEDSCPVSDH